MKKLGLKKETLAELTAADLAVIAGGALESQSCAITYTCVNVSDSPQGCFNSYVCATVGVVRALVPRGC